MSQWRRFSRLPQSPEYWHGLTSRMQRVAHATETVDEAPVRSLAPFAWLAIAASVLAVVASAALPPGPATAISIRDGLAPADSIAVTWLESTQPPSGSDLLIAQIGRPR